LIRRRSLLRPQSVQHERERAGDQHVIGEIEGNDESAAVKQSVQAGEAAIAEKPELTGRAILMVAIPETMIILGFAVAAMIIAAREIQQGLLPRRKPELPGYEVEAVWQSAREMAGDFYDYFTLNEQSFGVVIADVSDKGAPSALFMASVTG
jgi:serine phosphatase RsbU (regulator of sigma subunit)